MMRHVLKPLAVAVAACACCSCARTESENFNEIEDKALDIWVSSNAPDAEPLGDTGMYYEVIKALPDGSATKVDVRGRWVDVEYVIRDLNGDIVYNRNEATARLLGTFTKYTHYIPDRLYIASRQDLSDIPSGIYQAITEITPGETWRVYIPSRLAFASYGIQTSTGYGGQQALESDVPVILDSLRIVNIVDNPQSEGRQAIEEFVTASRPVGWGKPLNDTVREGLYMDILARPNPGDTVPLNQSANIYYRCGFLDGHLIDSNIDTVLYNRFGTVRSSDITSPIRVTRMSTDPNNANQMPAKVFYAILPDLCYGDSVRIAVPSEYGYYRQYMYPDKSSSMWSSSATFTFDFTYQYKDYTTEDTDYFFASSTYYMPYSTSSGTTVPVAEIKPYTPLIYEFVVQKPES